MSTWGKVLWALSKVGNHESLVGRTERQFNTLPGVEFGFSSVYKRSYTEKLCTDLEFSEVSVALRYSEIE